MKTLDKERLLQEVRDKGVEIDNIYDLMKIDHKYKDLIPILLKHLKATDDEDEKDFIVRCLCVKGFTEASKPLIHAFYQAKNPSYKWSIGNTLSEIRDKDVLPDLLTIVQEKEHGSARQMIVDGLGSFKNDENVKKVLVKLLDDDNVAGQAVSAIRRIGDPKLAVHIEPFLNHEKTWIRNEAKKAIEKFNKIKNA